MAALIRAAPAEFSTTSFYSALALYALRRFRETASIVETLVVPWAGAGPRCLWALAELASGNVAAARETLTAMENRGDTASAALLHAALGERDQAFAVFSATTDWDYWPALFVHHFLPDVLGPLRSDPRWQEILRNVARDWSGVSNRRVHHETRPPARSRREEIVRIVLGLDPREAVVVVAVGGRHTRLPWQAWLSV